MSIVGILFYVAAFLCFLWALVNFMLGGISGEALALETERDSIKFGALTVVCIIIGFVLRAL